MDALSIFRMVATEFAEIPDEDVVDSETGKVTEYGVTSYISLYSDLISKRTFGNSYEKAVAYLTAHKLKMMGKGSTDESSGIGTIADSLRISSVSEGETSVSFGTSQSNNLQTDAEYALTIYGLEFLTLKRLMVIPIVSAAESARLACETEDCRYPHYVPYMGYRR